VKKIVRQFAERSVLALALMSLCSLNLFAQGAHTHNQAEQNSATGSDQQNALVKVVRESTARFQDVKVAESAGYQFALGCVSGSDSGAMGLHYVNGALIGSGILDATRPQAVLYEARPDGSLRLTGVEFVVLADAWNAAHPDGPPQLMGQLFHFFEAPNRFGLPAFYALHVWAWKENPNGAFVNWHPEVSCKAFSGTAQ
jgi:hypothetical protein